MPDPDDEDEGTEPWELGASARPGAPEPPTDDYQRHLRAEDRWQSHTAAGRLWARIQRLLVGVS